MNLWRIAVDPRSGKPRGAPVPLSIPAQWAGFPSFSADGRQMAWATRVKSVNLERLPLDPAAPRVTGEAVAVTRGTFVINYASVSPDGRRIVLSLLGDQEDLMVVDREGGPLRRLTDDSFKDRLGFWAPDGRIVFYSNRRGQYNAWSIDPDGSNLRQLTANDVEPVFHPVPSPDGKSIAVCWGFAGAAIVDLDRPPEERRAERLPPAPAGSFSPNAWSSDGGRLVGTVAGQVVSFSLRDRTYETLARGGLPIWMADGERILYLDPESALRVADRRTRETRVLLRPPEGSFLEGLALSPDDRWLYLLRGTEEGDLWLSR